MSKSASFNHDMSDGDRTITSINLTGSIYISIQITATGLDAADATFNLQKSNDLENFGDVPDATFTFASGDSIRFIEFANPFGNSGLRIQIVVNSVTTGTLKFNVNFIDK